MFIIPLIAIGFLIFVHELGHFILAKLSGVKVSEFVLGFGPKVLKLKRGETTYGIAAFPLGGYVRMAGMGYAELGWEEELSPEEAHRGFNKQPIWRKAAIISAGPVMNIIIAVILFFVVFLILGTPVFPNKLAGVSKNSPAAQAGLKKGDRIVVIEGKEVRYAPEIQKTIRANPGKKITVVIERGGKLLNLYPTLLKRKDNTGFLGVEFRVEFKYRGLLPAFAHSIRVTGLVIGQIFAAIIGFPKILGALLAGKASGLSGPVGIYRVTRHVAMQGLVALLSLLGGLSVSLGIFNFIPLPPLDGGQVLFAGIEWVRGKPLEKNVTALIQAIGISFLLLLLLLVTYSDIINPIPGP